MNKPNNPPAFPLCDGIERGMTLRDYFAAKAMAAMIPLEVGKEYVEFKLKTLAPAAYEIADAMLEERTKQ